MSAPIILVCGAAGSGKDTVASLFSKYAKTVSIAQADPMKRFAHLVFGFSEEQLWGPSECRNAPDTRFDDVETWKFTFERLQYHGFAWIEQVLPDLSFDDQQKAFSALKKWFGKMRDDHLREKRTLTCRYMLQTLGTEWGRNFSGDMWNQYAIRAAKKILNGGYSYSRTRGVFTPETSAIEPEYVIITDGRFKNEVLGVQYVNGITLKVVNPKPTADAAKVEAAGVKGHKSETELNSIPNHFYSIILQNDKSQGLLALENRVSQIAASLKFGSTVNFGDSL